MAVNSTLRYINKSYDTKVSGRQSTYQQDSVAASFLNDIATPSMLHNGNTALPIGFLFGDDSLGHDISTLFSPIGGWNQQDYTPEATDGGKVWFCSVCGDGPKGIWQTCCTNCGHPRCAYCKVEETQ